MQPRTLLLPPKAGAWLVPKRTAHTLWRSFDGAAPTCGTGGAETPLTDRVGTLPARRVRVEHAGRASLSQMAVVAPSTVHVSINASP